MVQKSLLVIIVLVLLVACGGGAPAATTTPAPSATIEPTFTALPPTAPSTPTKAANTQGTNTSPTARSTANTSTTSTATSASSSELATVNEDLKNVTVLPIDISYADADKIMIGGATQNNGKILVNALELASIGQTPQWDLIPFPNGKGIISGSFRLDSVNRLVLKNSKLAFRSFNKWLSDNNAMAFIVGPGERGGNVSIVLGLDLLNSEGTRRPELCLETDMSSKNGQVDIIIVRGSSMRDIEGWGNLSISRGLFNSLRIMLSPGNWREITSWNDLAKRITSRKIPFDCYIPTEHPATVK